MNCNTEIHDEMITMDYTDCPFCDQELQQPSTIYLPCFEKQDMINNKGTNVCRNCGTANRLIFVKINLGLSRSRFTKENKIWKMC